MCKKMTLECLHFIRDNNKHLQGHQYQNHTSHIQDMKYALIKSITKYRIID